MNDVRVGARRRPTPGFARGGAARHDLAAQRDFGGGGALGRRRRRPPATPETAMRKCLITALPTAAASPATPATPSTENRACLGAALPPIAGTAVLGRGWLSVAFHQRCSRQAARLRSARRRAADVAAREVRRRRREAWGRRGDGHHREPPRQQPEAGRWVPLLRGPRRRPSPATTRRVPPTTRRRRPTATATRTGRFAEAAVAVVVAARSALVALAIGAGASRSTVLRTQASASPPTTTTTRPCRRLDEDEEPAGAAPSADEPDRHRQAECAARRARSRSSERAEVPDELTIDADGAARAIADGERREDDGERAHFAPSCDPRGAAGRRWWATVFARLARAIAGEKAASEGGPAAAVEAAARTKRRRWRVCTSTSPGAPGVIQARVKRRAEDLPRAPVRALREQATKLCERWTAARRYSGEKPFQSGEVESSSASCLVRVKEAKAVREEEEEEMRKRRRK